MLAGACLFVFGALLWLGNRIGWLRFGRLPGDIALQRDGFSLYFPIVTCILLSIIGTLILWLIGALRK